LHSSAYVFGPLPDLFSIPTSGNAKKATDGTRLLASLAASLDLGVLFNDLMWIKPNK
jgi:hypothetical protein